MTVFPKKGVKCSFTPSMEAIGRDVLAELAAPPVLVFSDWDAVGDGSRPFRICCDASIDDFDATLEQEQPDGSVRPMSMLAALPSTREGIGRRSIWRHSALYGRSSALEDTFGERRLAFCRITRLWKI